MITTAHQPADVGLLTIGAGNDVTCKFQDVSWDMDVTEVDVSGPCHQGAVMQTTGKQGRLSGSFYGGSDSGYVTNHLDFTSIQVGGVEVIPNTYSMDFSGGLEKANLPAATLGMAQGVIRRSFSGSLQMVLDDTEVVQSLIVAAESMDPDDAVTTLLFNLLGIPVTLPIKLGRTSHPIVRNDYQKVTIAFSGQAPNRGTPYPTTPAALPQTPGLLDWALLTPHVQLPFTFTSKIVHGLKRTGVLSFDDFGLNYSDRDITLFKYNFVTVGNWATTINES